MLSCSFQQIWANSKRDSVIKYPHPHSSRVNKLISFRWHDLLSWSRYLVGLLLISPLGDLVRRRQLVLLLVAASTTLTIGLAVTTDVRVFEALSFLIGVVTVTPQILMPLAADLAPPERRASALSVVLSGLMLGILIARVLAGVIGNFTTWRVV